MSDHSKDLELPINDWIFNQMEDPLLFIKESGEVIRCNPKAIEIIGEGRKSLAELMDLEKLKKQDRPEMVDIPPSGGRLYKVQCHAVETHNGVYAILLQPVSITDQTIEVKKKIDRLMNVTSEGMVIHEEAKIIDCDETFARMFGYEKEEVLKEDVFTLLDTESRLELQKLLHTYPETPYQLKGKKKDGTTFHIEILAHPYPQQDRILRVAIIRDITERVHNERKIEFMSYYDELTDLPNRHYFIKMVGEALRTEEGAAVHFMDLDYFKQINDTLCYSFGDELLKACAIRLKQLQDADTFIARMGETNFLFCKRM